MSLSRRNHRGRSRQSVPRAIRRACRFRRLWLEELETRRLLSYTVNDPGDAPLDPQKGPGISTDGNTTLRSAIQQVNLDGGGAINFSVDEVSATSPLPPIGTAVTINGGAVGTVVISGSGLDFTADKSVAEYLVINGSESDGIDISGALNEVLDDYIGTDQSGMQPVGNPGSGVYLLGSGNTISGCVIAANADSGITIVGGSNNVIRGNFIGTDITGTKALGNGGGGVDLFDGASHNSIGGTTASARNLISGNSGDGIDISGQATSDNVVQGNFIGTDITGSHALGNQATGVQIFAAATRNTIGSSISGAGNVISANGSDGIEISEQGTSNNVVQGNFIGADFTGTKMLGNANYGISIFASASQNTVGGTTSAARNLISGNSRDGIDISGQGTSGNAVQGNFIGTDVTGARALGNANYGVSIFASASHNTVGGTTAAARNVISGNFQDGIDISGSGTSGNLVVGNDIGLTAAAATPLANAHYGIIIFNGASGNTVGGRTIAAGNVVAGTGTASTSQSLYANVAITGAGTSNNLVEGNAIGTNADHARGLDASDTYGALIGGGASGNSMGGAQSSLGSASAALSSSGAAPGRGRS